MKSIYLYILLAFCISACIPVEDRLAPEILQIEFDGKSVVTDIDKNDVIITDTITYRVLDTMSISVRYTDNEQIDSIALLINQGSGIIENIKPLIKTFINIPGGKLYETTIQVPIPADTPEGIYHINIECYDLTKNRTRTYGVFNIKSDNKKPVIQGFKLKGVPQDSNGNYLVCRSEKIDFEGFVTDNIAISKIVVELDSQTRSRDAENLEKVSLTGLFDDVVVPPYLTNNRTTLMTIKAIDNQGNIDSVQVKLLIACDDVKPVLKINRINPIIRKEVIDIVKGSEVTIYDGYITDDFMLDRFAITFNLQGSERDTVFSQKAPSNPRDTLFFRDLPQKASRFLVPEDALINTTYELIFYLLDTAQNIGLYNYKVNVVRDNVPHISIVESFLLNSKQVVNAGDLASGTVKLSPGDVIKVPGEITDNNFQYIRIYWGEAGNPKLKHQILDKDLEKPYESYRLKEPINDFKIPSSAVSGSKYELRIEVKDLTNPPDSETFFFYVK